MIAGMQPPNSLRLVLWITISASLLGALFAYVENEPVGRADFLATVLRGALVGGLSLRSRYSYCGAQEARFCANCRFFPILRSTRYSILA
jgi:hypothetical protein